MRSKMKLKVVGSRGRARSDRRLGKVRGGLGEPCASVGTGLTDAQELVMLCLSCSSSQETMLSSCGRQGPNHSCGCSASFLNCYLKAPVQSQLSIKGSDKQTVQIYTHSHMHAGTCSPR